MPRLRVSGFGVRGINATDSPLHVRDDELLWAQNAEVRREDSFPALAKRRGFDLSTSGLEAPFHAITSVPFADPDYIEPVAGLIAFYAAVAGQRGAQSTNGTTWVQVSPPEVTSQAPGQKRWPIFVDKLHYVPDSNRLSIVSYDGVTATTVYTFPSPAILPDGNSWTGQRIELLEADSTYLHAVVFYTKGMADQVQVVYSMTDSYSPGVTGVPFSFNGTYTGAIVESIFGLAVLNGEVFVASEEGVVGPDWFVVRRAAPLASGWTADYSASGFNDVSYSHSGMVSGNSRIVLVADGNDGSAPALFTRTVSGWASPLTGSAFDRFYPVLVARNQGLVLHWESAANQEHLLATVDWAVFSDLGGDITSGEPVWTPSYRFGTSDFCAKGLGTEFSVKRLEGTSISTVFTSGSGFALRSFGGWR